MVGIGTKVEFVSLSLLSPGTGSVVPEGGLTVAVFAKAPVVPDGMVPFTEKVAEVPDGRSTKASMSPVPEAVPQDAPEPLGVHVQANPESSGGSVSCTLDPVASLGPLLLTTMV